jgi:oxygen-independent coproporphyrinogen III oxidase
LPVERGYVLDEDDVVRRHVVTQLMCNMQLDTRRASRQFDIEFDTYFAPERQELASGPIAHGFLREADGILRVTPTGRLFVRNICMIFDRHLRQTTGQAPVFSRTV